MMYPLLLYTPELMIHLPRDFTYTNHTALLITAVIPMLMLPEVPRVMEPAVGTRTTKPLKPPIKFGMIVLICVDPVTRTMSVLTLMDAAEANVLSDSLLVVPGIIFHLQPPDDS
jgi:hypothetical protein